MVSNIVSSIIIGIISGIISAAVFHCILRRTTPKIKISKQIEKREINGEVKYHIKVVNLRKRFAVNVMPFLDLVHSENGPDGTILCLKALEIHADDIPYIDPYSRRDSDAKYAVRVEITDSLEKIWENDRSQHLQLKIFCIDEFSGSGKLFQQTYYQRKCIINGRFETGKSLNIVPM